MQTCLWTQRIWIYNHLISISKYTHQISTSLILIFSFSDWNNGWSILTKKQTIVCFVGFLFSLRVCSCATWEQNAKSYCQHSRSSQHLCRRLHSRGPESTHFLFVFLLCFLHFSNPVRMKPILFVWSRGSTQRESFPLSVVGIWARLPQAEWNFKVKFQLMPILGQDTSIY